MANYILSARSSKIEYSKMRIENNQDLSLIPLYRSVYQQPFLCFSKSRGEIFAS